MGKRSLYAHFTLTGTSPMRTLTKNLFDKTGCGLKLGVIPK